MEAEPKFRSSPLLGGGEGGGGFFWVAIPGKDKTREALLLEDIGRVLNEARVTKDEALQALKRVRREIHGWSDH